MVVEKDFFANLELLRGHDRASLNASAIAITLPKF